MTQEKKLLQRWKELNVKNATFDFDCGGDCMGETELTIINNDEESVEDENFEKLLESEIYRNVEFYEASDGHYIGEKGTVNICFDDELNDLVYDKMSTSQLEEQKTITVPIELTDKEVDFLNSHVSVMRSFSWSGGEEVIYKNDFILTPELEDIQNGIEAKFLKVIDNGDELDTEDDIHFDSLSYSTIHPNKVVIEPIKIYENDSKFYIDLYVSYSYTVFDEYY